MKLLQSAAKLYALRMSAHLALGLSADAYGDFQEGFRLTTATVGEPTAIAGLVRISLTVVMINAMWGGLEAHQWTPTELQKLEADLETLDWLKDYIFVMGSERGGLNLLWYMVIERPDLLNDSSQKNNIFRKYLVYGGYGRNWSYKSQVRLNRFFDEEIARIDPKKRRIFSDRSAPSSPENIHGILDNARYVLFKITAPVLEQLDRKFVQASALTDQARLACALERFRIARGSFPVTLGELAPEFISTVPLEVVNGEPYHYRLTNDGSFVLYSVGMDLHDDGGVIDPTLPQSKQRDLVWRYPAK